jgi:hypothetical protein
VTRFGQGKKDEAREAAQKGAAAMRLPPQDDQGSMARNSNPNNLMLWLACKEAKTMIGFAEPPAAPARPDSQ